MIVVERLLHTPVKSLRLVEREAIELGLHGAADDRVFFLLGEHGGSLRGSARLPLVRASATFDDGVLSLVLPDGGVVAGEPEIVEDETLRVRWDADLEVDAHPVRGPWDEALSDLAGQPVRLARVAGERGGWSIHPVSLIGSPSIDALGLGPLDARRFRMLIRTAGGAPFAEDAWAGREVAVGDAVIRVVETCARCTVTTVDPDTGERDADALRAMVEAKGVADLGVYGDVVAPGRVAVGDAVRPL